MRIMAMRCLRGRMPALSSPREAAAKDIRAPSRIGRCRVKLLSTAVGASGAVLCEQLPARVAAEHGWVDEAALPGHGEGARVGGGEVMEQRYAGRAGGDVVHAPLRKELAKRRGGFGALPLGGFRGNGNDGLLGRRAGERFVPRGRS